MYDQYINYVLSAYATAFISVFLLFIYYYFKSSKIQKKLNELKENEKK